MTHTTHTTPGMWESPVLNNLDAAQVIAAAGETAGLPTPFDVAVTEYRVSLTLWTADDVRAWADFLDTEATTTTTAAERLYTQATAQAFGTRVDVASSERLPLTVVPA